MHDPNDRKTLYELAGGDAGLRPALADFVASLFVDPMIGFHFRGVDARRLERLEWQVAARALGAELPYEGRPLDTAHVRHRILGGQFARRTQLLRQALDAHGVLPAARDALLAHNEDQRHLVVTEAAPGRCDPVAATAGPLVTQVIPRSRR